MKDSYSLVTFVDKKPLTKVQKRYTKMLQNGWEMITSSEAAVIANGHEQEHLTISMFWKLVRKGVIAQQLSWPFNYILTNHGKSIKC